MLNNLLSNAARHSSELSPIRVAAVRDGVHVAFSVADYGVGVPAERLPHLFRKFSRLDGEERGREVGGSGLGLAICKGIVEAHGGRIRAESDGPGLGSRFTFTLPAVKEPARGAPPGGPGHGLERNRSRPASSAWTTTRRPSATSGTPSPGRAMRPSSPETRRRSPASWRSKRPTWSCWTWCCRAATASS